MKKVFTIILMSFVLGICSTYSEEKYEFNTIKCNSIELNKFIVDSTVSSYYYTWFQYHYNKTSYTIIRVNKNIGEYIEKCKEQCIIPNIILIFFNNKINNIIYENKRR